MAGREEAELDWETRYCKLLKLFKILLILSLVEITLALYMLAIFLNPYSYPSGYDYFKRTKIEIKGWINMNGTHGMEIVPSVSLNGNYYNKVVGDMQPLWLDNRYRYFIEAKPEEYGYCFLFWQRESDGLIIPDRKLVLEPGFNSDKWWANYGKCGE